MTDLVKFEELGSIDQPREHHPGDRPGARSSDLLATETVDSTLGEGRPAHLRRAAQRIEAELQTRHGGAGIRILFVGIEGVHPPRDTAAAFEGVVQGRQMKAGAIETAQKDANDELIKVAGSVEKARAISAAISELDTIRSAPRRRVRVGRAGQARRRCRGQGAGPARESGGTGGVRDPHGPGRAPGAPHGGPRPRGELRRPDGGLQGRARGVRGPAVLEALRSALAATRVYIVAGDGNVEVRTNLEDISTGGVLFNLPKPRGNKAVHRK